MNIEPSEIDVETADGLAHAWCYRGGEGPRPAVILFMDAYGVRPAMHELAGRLARLGYLVLLPDLFYRTPGFPPFDIATVWTDPPERDRVRALIQSLTTERVERDGRAWLDAVAAQPGVRPDRVGVTGYCMGGRLAYLTAALHGDRVRAAAAFHAGGLVTDAPDSPHRLADRLRARLYLGVADEDRSCTPEQQGALAAALGAAHVDHGLELYRGRRHGFAVPDNAGAYSPEAAERHWRRLEAFFGEALA